MTRVLVVEDTPLEIPLSELGWDEDGDELTFEVSGSHQHLDVAVLTHVLRLFLQMIGQVSPTVGT